ncbi:Beta-galactosidase-1-like protein 2 [Acropora cervicornis]|uniref:Beta-galactosidase-1-like protein 2 n=1 Tax=Acropora cervicornis TaxID=6130 RepID=A0AAD9R613_ACRCE|nr:Beta-galactosidase-1-like protein 2 [Acropora cervicornis]
MEQMNFNQRPPLMFFKTLQRGHMKSVESDKVLSMEELPINNNGGQGYGFILYQTEISQVPREISIDNVLDRAQVLLNSLPVHTYDASLGYKSTIELKIDDKVSSQLEMPCKVEILVENMGRSNYGGTWFSVDKSSKSHKAEMENLPSGIQSRSFIKPKDTFLLMKNWTKGVCFINGHNLGRYWSKGPQQTLYVPAPWLQKGQNELIIFELHSFSSADVSFVESQIFN